MPGGARKGAGRKPGAVSLVKRELADKAKEYADEALSVLATLMRTSTADAVRVSAAQALLDRGYGKPFQAVQHSNDPEHPLVPTVINLVPVEGILPDGECQAAEESG